MSELTNFDNQAIKAQVTDILVKHGLDFTIRKEALGINVGADFKPSGYYGLYNGEECIQSSNSARHCEAN